MSETTLRYPGRNTWVSLILAAVLILSFAACGDDDENGESSGVDAGGDLAITDVWARPVVLLDGTGDGDEDGAATVEDAATEQEMDMDAGGTNGVVYMTMENTGDEDDRLLSAGSAVAGAVELHTVNMADGVMQMRQVEGGIELPAGETVALEPGGLHIMLVGLTGSLEIGDVFDLDLQFERAGPVTVEVEVRES